MLICVEGVTLNVKDLKRILDNNKSIYDFEVMLEDNEGTKTLTYCLFEDFVTFIPDYDTKETLTVSKLLKDVLNHDDEDYLVVNFVEASILMGVSEVIVDNCKRRLLIKTN